MQPSPSAGTESPTLPSLRFSMLTALEGAARKLVGMRGMMFQTFGALVHPPDISAYRFARASSWQPKMRIVWLAAAQVIHHEVASMALNRLFEVLDGGYQVSQLVRRFLTGERDPAAGES